MTRLAVILCLLALPLWAVEPDEMLDDPILEARARALDDALRCVQCQSESIASSNADWARDARLIVRDLVSSGESDQAVLDYFVERYGEVVLMRPRSGGANIVLWAAGPLMLLVGAGIALAAFRRPRVAAAPLSAEEEARFKRILGGED